MLAANSSSSMASKIFGVYSLLLLCQLSTCFQIRAQRHTISGELTANGTSDDSVFLGRLLNRQERKLKR